jgi:thiol-disulfide isomerase/thioredoxin
MKSGPRLIAILAVAGALSLAALYLIARPQSNDSSPDEASPAAQQAVSAGYRSEKTPLPDAVFQNDRGETLSTADFRGRWILLNLWASWCLPCREELPSLDRLQAQLGSKEFEVVAVSMDRNGMEEAEAFLLEAKATHLALYGDPTSKMMFVLKAVGLPTTFLISPKGEIVGRFVGPVDWDTPQTRELIQSAISPGN